MLPNSDERDNWLLSVLSHRSKTCWALLENGGKQDKQEGSPGTPKS